MSSALFAYPKQAAFQRVLPKTKIYEYAKPSRAVRDKFVDEVSQIVWQYKLSPETINLPARQGVPEIQVFGVALKTEEISESVLRCIDKAIQFPIFYELTHGDRIKSTAAYKRPSESDSGKWVVDAYFETPWKSANTARIALPVSLDLDGLYEQMLRVYIDVPRREGESLKEQVARIGEIRGKQKECEKLELQMKQEIQFNRKVELNAQLRRVRQELKILRG